MKRNPVERRLQKYHLLQQEIDFLQTEVLAAEEMLKTLNNFHINLEDDVREKVDLRIQNLKEQMAAHSAEKTLIEAVINGLEDTTAREIFKLKYFSKMVWPSIAKKTGYSERQCRRIHTDTIEKIISQKMVKMSGMSGSETC